MPEGTQESASAVAVARMLPRQGCRTVATDRPDATSNPAAKGGSLDTIMISGGSDMSEDERIEASKQIGSFAAGRL
jgi:hypothetical protein